MTSTTDVAAPRTYGGWRRPTRPGLGRLGLVPTLLLLVGLLLSMGAMAYSLKAAAAVAVAMALGLTPVILSDKHHRTALQGAGARLEWQLGKQARRHLYRSGPTGRLASARWSLPGLAANVTAQDVLDAAGKPFAILHHPTTNTVTAVLETSPEGGSLVDERTVDLWVAEWGNFLSAAGQEASMVGLSVTIETAPDPGTRLANELHRRMSVRAPELARSVLDEILASYPRGAATTTSRVALSWSCSPRVGTKRRSPKAMGAEIARRLPQLSQLLAATGAGASHAMNVQELAAAFRTAYDPASAAIVEAAGPGGVPWEDCGPVSADEAIDRYAHDGAVSCSWTMTAAPRGAVQSAILAPLLAPHPDIARKRVTLHYRPYSPGQAATLVDRDQRDALFKAHGRKVTRATDVVALRAAEQAAAEDARGAGLVRFGMIVTATVDARQPDALAVAEAVVDGLATTSRLVLRPAWRTQATTFLAGLPIGLLLPQHLRMPAEFREIL
jgi:hypothetical protein